MNEPIETEVVILGAGGAGMMCAIHAGKRGRKVLLVDHAKKLGGKILISGGGRCNFTNLGASPGQYVSKNPHFCKSALSRFPASAFIEMVTNHGIAYHEKTLGQLFCDDSAQNILSMLQTECEDVGAEFLLECKIEKILQATKSQEPKRFQVQTNLGHIHCDSLVIATGGLSLPQIGATGLGFSIAEQFGIAVTETAPALDGYTFPAADTPLFSELAGLSADVVLSCGGKSFREKILFTHTGLSGPAALQGSLHWYPGYEVTLNLLPDTNVFEWFKKKKKEGNRSIVKNLLSELLPARLAELLCKLHFSSTLPLPQVSEKDLEAFCHIIHAWKIKPSGTVGYKKAEVTRGGVDTDELSSKTMESKKIPGLYFIGEVVDVTGWLGGYNFQWAWASGWASGQVV